ncbi:uncharacterized protein LOC135126750 isoform X3 [Zophobas morio]|uniref:uncharacterized protein LOC135126750 isoform X3 n=1 Tax=Zophobas morio TaxID=2755281 RepID=UPI0030830C52
MNSALKPVLTSSTPQNPPVTTQLNKPMHPQGTPTNYGQPSTHMPQSLVNLPHNPTVAHAHPNPAHQSNHYSLNVPNAPQHYSANNPSAIPASNHPIPNVSQAGVGGQSYAPNKNVPFAGGYQPNLGHPPNQNPIPPVSQSLPATQPPLHTPPPAESSPDKPQSNGTAEVKSPTKPEPQENHVSLPRDKSPLPPSSPKICERSEEKPASTALPEQKPPSQESSKTAEETPSSTPEVSVSNSPSAATSAPSVDNVEAVPATANDTEPPKTEEVAENSESSSRESQPEVVDTSSAEASSSSPPKPKEKEQQKTTPASKTTTPKTPTRKSKTPKPDGDSPKSSKVDVKTPSTQKSPTVGTKSKRTRIKTQPYQSPLPEIEIITKISSSTPRSRTNDDKLIVFYKNEFLAVRNSEGSFYICQAVQNIYKSSPKIRIRWLSQDKTEKSGEVYTPDFYDNTDFDCILTNLNLVRVDKGRFRLPPAEKERTDSILKRSLAVEKGEVTSPSLTEEHPDGIDLSLYKEESQLKKRKATKRKATSALRTSKKSSTTTKSPDQPKVRKVVAKPTKRAPPKRVAPTAKVKRVIPVEAKKPTTTVTSRTDRAKRRGDNQNHNKVSPVVDQKKARVLAKVARKGAVNTKSQSDIKAPKATPSSSKVQKAVPKAAPKKTKRSSRK